jgi:hypothetical protein
MPPDADPLKFVQTSGGRPKVDAAQHATLAEALRAFGEKLDQADTTRLLGGAVQDLFALAPYGWSKDATRYVFAGLLYAGEIVLYTAAGEVTARGPAAVEAMKGTQAFAKVGVGLRDVKPSMDTLVRAADRLESLTGARIMPLEDDVTQAAREHLPARLVALAGLPAQLRAQGIAGADRAQKVLDTWNAIIQGDGSGAVAVLGAADCTFPDDVRWAEKAARELENAEEDLVRTRRVIGEAESVIRYFPVARGIFSEADRAIVDDVLKSESFFDRVPDLRKAIRQMLERAKTTYQVQLENFRGDLAKVRLRLESQPEWQWLTDEDRADLMARLPAAPTDAAGDGEGALYAIGALLSQHQHLPRLEVELIEEARSRGKKPPVNGGDGEATVDLAELLPRFPLADETAVERWLDEVRSRLRLALAEGRPVRLLAEAGRLETVA